MIFGALGRHMYPAGFGPGVNATFHRILVLGYALFSVFMLSLYLFFLSSIIGFQPIKFLHFRFQLIHNNAKTISSVLMLLFSLDVNSCSMFYMPVFQNGK